MTNTTSSDGKTPDLETQIRDAEQRVVAADRDWRRHNDAMAEALRGKAGRAAKVGSAGVGVAVVGLVTTLLLRKRLSAKARRARDDRFFAETIARLRQPSSARSRESALPVPAPVAKAPRWHAALAAVGTLIGAAATAGLGLRRPGARGGGFFSMLMGVAMPLLTRWLRGRDQPRR